MPQPDVRIYQIGLGSFGRYGFEKFLGMEKNLESANIKFEGICEEDREKLGKAMKFASSTGKDLKGFTEIDKLYEHASKHDETVLIYDAGPSQLHSENIVRSLQNDFYHLAEKPPSLTREGFIHEKKLSDKRNVFWKVDFIERENPVVKKTKELLKDEIIEEIKIFRESSIGIEKTLQPVDRIGVKGGDIIDKMFHEIYLLDFLKAAGEEFNPRKVDAEAKYLLPKTSGSDSLMNIYGSKTDTIDNKTATAQTYTHIKNNSIDIELHSSWVGLSDKARTLANSFEGIIGEKIHNRELKKTEDNKNFVDEEARFFIIEGSISLLGDMLNKKLYNLDTEEEIQTPNPLQDQLYRVLEKAALDAAKQAEIKTNKKEMTEFSNLIFDIKEKAIENSNDFYTELDKGRERINNFIPEDKPESLTK